MHFRFLRAVEGVAYTLDLRGHTKKVSDKYGKHTGNGMLSVGEIKWPGNILLENLCFTLLCGALQHLLKPHSSHPLP